MSRKINTAKVTNLLDLLATIQQELLASPLHPYSEESLDDYAVRMHEVDDSLLMRYATTLCMEDLADKVHDRDTAIVAIYHGEYDFSNSSVSAGFTTA